MNDSFQIDPLTPACGAVIHGIDLAQPLPDTLVKLLQQALLDHLVLFFREQSLMPSDQIRVAKYFGTVDRYPMLDGLPDYPDIVEVTKLEHERVNFGGLWHSDTAYLQEPSMGSVLLAREVPPVGGDTLWANMYLAYESLSRGMKRLLDGRMASYSSSKDDVARTRADRISTQDREEVPETYTASHPMVRRHPETGRKALYVSGAHTVRIEGLTETESTPILTYLYRHQVQPEFTCRFQWHAGSLAVWDNRCTIHNPINDYHGHRRVMHRISLKGEVPV